MITQQPISATLPQLVLAQADVSLATNTAEFLSRLGWDVHVRKTGIDARHLAHRLSPEVVVLGTDLQGESAWLTCAKLTLLDREQAVVLLAKQVTPEDEAFARLVHARDIVAYETQNKDWLTSLSTAWKEQLMISP